MAIIKCGGLIADIRGKLGDNVFTRGQGGAMVRDVGSWTQSDNDAQVVCREALEDLARAWSSNLTEAERATWRSYAQTNPRPNRWGTRCLTNAYTQFVRHNFHAYLDSQVIQAHHAPHAAPIHPPQITIEVQQAAAIQVTGALDPDVTGTYTPGGQYQGHPYWQCDTAAGMRYISKCITYWRLSTAPGAWPGPTWYDGLVLSSPMDPIGGASGEASWTWSYDASLARITTPPSNYPDPPDGLTLYIYSGIPIGAGRRYYQGPFLKLVTLPPAIAAVPATTWLRWTWPTRSVEPSWAWPPDGSGSARFYAIAQDATSHSISTRAHGSPTFESLTPW